MCEQSAEGTVQVEGNIYTCKCRILFIHTIIMQLNFQRFVCLILLYRLHLKFTLLHVPPQCEWEWCLILNPILKLSSKSQVSQCCANECVFGVTGAYEKRQAGRITRRSGETEQGPLLLIHTWSLSWLSRSVLQEGKHRRNQTRRCLCGAREAGSPADIREHR